MNGAGTRNGFGYETEPLAPLRDVMPSPRAMAQGYSDAARNGFAEEEEEEQKKGLGEEGKNSQLVDLSDPIQVHLLTETALADSREWAILSQEEVDDLKKQCRSLQQRIEQTRANLAIQSKYRDAAISMTKLYSPTTATPGGKRRSLLGHRHSHSHSSTGSASSTEASREAEAERVACERRCEELASELFQLEKRLMEPQRKLFQHTAGILQLTHKASAKKAAAAAAAAANGTNGQSGVNGMPGSPESLYTYSNGRESMEIVHGNGSSDGLDDRSLFFPVEDGRGGGGLRDTIAIPVKSPIRKETKELREEGDRLREEQLRLQNECTQLRATNDAMGMELDALQRDYETQAETATDTERQLAELNQRLRSVLVGFDPVQNESYSHPPEVQSREGDHDHDGIPHQLQYLADSLTAVSSEQQRMGVAAAKQTELETVLAQVDARLAALNNQLQEILTSHTATGSQGNQALAPPPPPTDDATNVAPGLRAELQLNWLQQALGSIETAVTRADEAYDASHAEREMVQQTDEVLQGLWQHMQSGRVEAKKRREERRAARAQMGVEEEEEEKEGDDDDTDADLDQAYSLQTFAATVQRLHGQSTQLREHKTVLQRQIRQQRELNSKSDADREKMLQDKDAALQRMQQTADDAQDQLARALADLNEASGQIGEASRAREAAAAEAAAASEKAEQTALAAERMQQATTEAEEAVAEATQRAAEASQRADAAAAEAKQLRESLEALQQQSDQFVSKSQKKDAELEALHAMVVELKTEATIAKAELEGAYGTRAQRAAEAKSSENSELQGQLDRLRSELTSTLRDYEVLTQDAVAAEREKVDLEAQLDDALASKSTLETEARRLRDKHDHDVAALQEQLDAERLKVVVPPASPAGSRAGTGTTMLSEQFRATMKEERKKFHEELRRRKLEEEIRALKRAAGPNKSPLSPRS